jgi:hypothetical protein
MVRVFKVIGPRAELGAVVNVGTPINKAEAGVANALTTTQDTMSEKSIGRTVRNMACFSQREDGDE